MRILEGWLSSAQDGKRLTRGLLACMMVELLEHAPLPVEKSKIIRAAANSSKRSVTNREIVTHRTDGG
jgi:hypothetical protein